MTRAEEAAELAGFIKIHSYDDAYPMCKEEHYAERDCFIRGYEQAETETIDRACKWLSSPLPIIVDFYNEDIHDQADRGDFIRRFRKDMEEGKV